MTDQQDSDAVFDEWRTYDEFAAGIDTYRLKGVSLEGRSLVITLDDGAQLSLNFGADAVTWTATGSLEESSAVDPYDAVAVRPDVFFVSLPLTSRLRESLVVIFSTTTHRALVTHSRIADRAQPGVPQVSQQFWAGTTDGGPATGEVPAPSRDLIGKRNVYRYSPEHLYEHIYLSSTRYAWQCIDGVQRGHGDTDLSTVWRFAAGLYLFCFREFRIPVASVWLHDLGYQLRTTGIFLGLDGEDQALHSRAGGHIYPLGSVSYPDSQPV